MEIKKYCVQPEICHFFIAVDCVTIDMEEKLWAASA